MGSFISLLLVECSFCFWTVTDNITLSHFLFVGGKPIANIKSSLRKSLLVPWHCHQVASSKLFKALIPHRVLSSIHRSACLLKWQGWKWCLERTDFTGERPSLQLKQEGDTPRLSRTEVAIPAWGSGKL